MSILDCSKCSVIPHYHYDDIADLNQNQVNMELSNHGHLQNRTVKTKGKHHQRRTDEGKDE